MKKIKYLIVAALLFLLGACSASPNANIQGGVNSPGDAEAGESINGGGTGNNQYIIPEGHKIIYTGEYTINVEEKLSNAINQINGKVYELGGHISSSTENLYEGTYIYKIPSAKMNDFLNFTDGLGGVVNKSITSEDVTSIYNELEAELEVLQASRTAYENMLLNDKLTSSEIDTIRNKIASLDVKIKTAVKNIDNYNKRIDYATFTVKYKLISVTQEDPWLADYGNYLLKIGKGLVEFIVYTAPFALIAGGFVTVVYFIKKRKK